MRALAALPLVLLASAAFADTPRVDEIEVRGPITPVVAGYVERGIEEATRDDAALLLFRLDTPGGSIEVMQRVSQALRASQVPVCVWVAPRGAFAASAGTFLVLSAGAAAMAPETSLGAASPVGSRGEDLESTVERKAKNILVTQIRALAARRGERAVRWAEAAVREAASAGADEALELGLIDQVADDRDVLLARLDGATVPLGADFVVLRTAGAEVRAISMSTIEKFLHVLADPTVAYLLLTLGMFGVLFELASPGGIVPGVVGGACLLFAAYALGVLPVNSAGLLLIGLAFLLFAIDVKAQTHGALTVGGIAALAIGGIVLFPEPHFEVSRKVVWTVAVGSGAFFAFAVSAAVRARLAPPATGVESMVGTRGVVRSALAPVGMVMVQGELWRARAGAGNLDAGTQVEIESVDGMELRVREV